jgi:histidinol-phosphate aminotransferase
MTYEYERVITPASGLRLHLNENTAGCSPRVVEAIRSLTREQAAFYPDYERANAACARRLGVLPEQVLLTNGLDEGIFATSVAALRSSAAGQAEAIIVVPAFDMYAACAETAGGRIIEVPTEAGFEFPLDALLRAIGPRTRLVFLTTPNNPTGQAVRRADILKIAAKAHDALIFVDEAYADFNGETQIAFPFSGLPNVIIGRTFAKAYGLAAIRAGALVGDPKTLAPLRRVVPPYSLNVCATLALQAAIEDTEYYDWYLAQAEASKALLYQALDRLGIRYWPSAANFVLADFGPRARRVVDGLAARQIFVRDRSRDPACPGCVRITAGIVEHTRTCINALEEVLCGAAS